MGNDGVGQIGCNETKSYSPLKSGELQAVLQALDESTIVAVTDAAWNITYVNDRFCQVSGYASEELIGKNHRMLNSGSHSKEFWNEMYQDLSSGRTWKGTVCNQAKDGSFYWVDSVCTPILDEDGSLCGAIALRYETTKLHLTLEQLAESNDRAQLALKGCVEGLYQYESHTDKLWFSERFHELLGLESERLGLCFSELLSRVHPIDLRKWTDGSFESQFKNGNWEAEFRLRNQTGEFHWYRLVSKRIAGESGGDWAVAGSISNIEKLKHREYMITEAHLAAEQASRVKMDFLTNMSHEIRTPMTAIIGYLDFLDGPSEDSDGLRPDDAVAVIRRNATHLLSLINDILDVSKIETGKMMMERVVVSLREVVLDTVSLFQHQVQEKGISFGCNFDNSVPQWIESDPTRLRQILFNLVGNAVKFTETGSVTIKVSCDHDANLVAFQVVDTGIGMTEEQRKMVARFDAFNQADSSTSRRFGGTGLGLHISHLLAGMLGGGIDIRSSQGEGSVFTATIATGDLNRLGYVDGARCAESSQDAASVKAGEGLPLAGLSILLAEDSPDIQRLISVYLKRAGAELVTVENGELAVESVLENREHPFDLVLMDMQMPIMDGYEAVKAIRDEQCTIPVIAVTAHAVTGARCECIEAGCDDYLTKPVIHAELIEMCQKWGFRNTKKAA